MTDPFMVEYCTTCGFLQEVEILRGPNADQMKPVRLFFQGRGSLPHVSNIEIADRCGPWGIALAYRLNGPDDPPDILIPGIARMTVKLDKGVYVMVVNKERG